MSDTPETDRLAEEFKRNTLPDDVKLHVLFGYTRKLERECIRLERERDEARERLRIAVGLLSTQPQFADKHPEEVLAFVKEVGK